MTFANRGARRGRRRGRIRLAPLLLLALLAGAGILASRHFFHRSGEAAIEYIPKDALVVLTVDTTPSPSQALLFRRIASALDEEHMQTRSDEVLSHLFAHAPLSDSLRSTMTGSFASAVLPGPDNDIAKGRWVLLAALKDVDRARHILSGAGASREQNGLQIYHVMQERASLAVIDNYLVSAGDDASLLRIDSTRQNRTDSVGEQRGFQDARAALPFDSNLMLFVAPEAQRQTGNALLHGLVGAVEQPARWLALGAALHEEGIDADLQWPVDAQSGVPSADLMHIAPISSQLLRKMPGGAYGLMAVSQPNQYWNWANDSTRRNPEMSRSMDQGMAQFERETGMSVPRDVLPAFGGDLALALYRDASGDQKSADGLIVLDDANGADPVALAALVRQYVERESARNGQSPVQFVPETRNGATLWRLDPATQSRLQSAISGDSPNASADTPDSHVEITNRAGNIHIAGGGSGNNVDIDLGTQSPGVVGGNDGHIRVSTSSGNSVDISTPDGHPSVAAGGMPDTGADAIRQAAGRKQPCYAEVGHVLLIASSQAMLDRALAAYSGGANSLYADPTCAPLRRQIDAGAQIVMMADLPGIMESLRPGIVHWLSDAHTPVTPDDLIGIFGHGAGGVCTERYDGKMVHASFTLPLDYIRFIHVIGEVERSMDAATHGTPAASSPDSSGV